MKKRLRVAGLLDELAGIIMFLAGFGVFIIGGLFVIAGGARHGELLLRPVAVMVIAVFAIYGGACAWKGTRYGWAIAGSVCALPALFGIAALILLLTSKEEFGKPELAFGLET